MPEPKLPIPNLGPDMTEQGYIALQERAALRGETTWDQHIQEAEARAAQGLPSTDIVEISDPELIAIPAASDAEVEALAGRVMHGAVIATAALGAAIVARRLYRDWQS